MPDRVFYPFILLIAAALAIAALVGGPDRIVGFTGEPLLGQDSLVARGPDLAAMRAADGLTVEFLPSAEDLNHARLRAFRRPEDGAASAGVFLTISPRQESALSGRTVRVSILARARGAEATERFLAQYATSDSPGDSGWIAFEPDAVFRTYSFTHAIPEKNGPPGLDFIGVWPDPDGEGRALDIIQLSVEPIDP